MSWKTINRPGYFGKKRDELYAAWNANFGEGNWRIAWQWGSLVLDKPEALQIYEDGYYEFLKTNPQILEWLIETASDVYDTAPTNIKARFSYDIQETPNNHLHDVAVRRAVFRNGVWFYGEHLVQIRGEGTEGELLSPHLVPFHKPQMILDGEIGDPGNKGFWWRELGVEKSVEEFYQHNKVLQVKD